MDKQALEERLTFNIKTVLRAICTPETLARIEDSA